MILVNLEQSLIVWFAQCVGNWRFNNSLESLEESSEKWPGATFLHYLLCETFSLTAYWFSDSSTGHTTGHSGDTSSTDLSDLMFLQGIDSRKLLPTDTLTAACFHMALDVTIQIMLSHKSLWTPRTRKRPVTKMGLDM